MTIYQRPDGQVFAEGARQGEVHEFPDLLRGWGITFEQTEGKPPMEWFNFLHRRIDQSIGYFLQRGIAEWAASQDYPKDALTQYAGALYVAVRANKGAQPDSSSSDWRNLAAEDLDASKLKRGTVAKERLPAEAPALTAGKATALATPRVISLAGDAVAANYTFDGTRNVQLNITLSSTGVRAGTYSKVTVDAKGRVSAGASLAAGDIPEIPQSNVTGLQGALNGKAAVNHSHSWSQISGAPGILGQGQSWQAVTRVSGTTYTNTTGKPIMVHVRSTGDASSTSATLSISGVDLSQSSYNGRAASVCAVVPSGTSYRVAAYPGMYVCELR